MSCNVRVTNKNPEAQALIPYKAVTEQMGEFFVYVVERDSAWQHKVVLGAPIKDKVIIKEGLEAGQVIVVEGIQKLRNATAVQVGPPPASPMAGAPKK
jgi:membrane fusion protein (multidrug efflux system)